MIGFDFIEGPEQIAYSGHTEQGFDIAVTEGVWAEAAFFGAPVPSVFTRSDQASLSVTAATGGPFGAGGFQIGNGGFSGAVGYAVTGSLAGTEIYRLTGSMTETAAFAFVPLAGSSLIDTLLIELDGSSTVSLNIDSILVKEAPTVMPLPGALGMLILSGLALLGLKHRSLVGSRLT